MAIRLVRDIYSLIYAFLDPPSKTMMAFSCKSFLKFVFPLKLRGSDSVINLHDMVMSKYYDGCDSIISIPKQLLMLWHVAMPLNMDISNVFNG